MAIQSTLSVSQIQDLRNEASAFQTHAEELQVITNQMFDLVGNTSSVWNGQDQQAYTNQFDGLRDEMSKLFDMVNTYCANLNDIASSYQAATDSNVSIASSLQTDIPLV